MLAQNIYLVPYVLTTCFAFTDGGDLNNALSLLCGSWLLARSGFKADGLRFDDTFLMAHTNLMNDSHATHDVFCLHRWLLFNEN